MPAAMPLRRDKPEISKVYPRPATGTEKFSVLDGSLCLPAIPILPKRPIPMPWHTTETQRGLIQTIKNGGPYAYFITLPFLKIDGRTPLSLNESVGALNHVIKAINRKLFGSNGKKRGKQEKRGEYIEGFICIENHKLGGFHFHGLIAHNQRMFVKGKQEFKEIFYNAALSLHRQNPKTGYFNSYPLTSREHLDCQFIERSDPSCKSGIFNTIPSSINDRVRYVTKDIHKPLIENKKHYERWCFIEHDGINLTDKDNFSR